VTAVVLLSLAGGPALDVLMLGDPRLVVERWLDRLPAGTVVEVAGNAHFQARVPLGLRAVNTTPESLRRQMRGPVGDVVLFSSFDESGFARGDLRFEYLDVVETGGRYRPVMNSSGPPWSVLARGLFVSPRLRVFQRADSSASLPP
jgi:translation initiation factor IF-1